MHEDPEDHNRPLFTFFCEVALCLLLIMGIKKLLGRRSRYVIGS